MLLVRPLCVDGQCFSWYVCLLIMSRQLEGLSQAASGGWWVKANGIRHRAS